MLELKRAIETMHARLVVQEEKNLVQDKIIEEQKVINFTVTKEAAKLKGDCNTLQGTLEADLQNLRDHMDATFNALKPLIVTAASEAIEARIAMITRDLS